jgi:hypothetical protein
VEAPDESRSRKYFPRKLEIFKCRRLVSLRKPREAVVTLSTGRNEIARAVLKLIGKSSKIEFDYEASKALNGGAVLFFDLTRGHPA